MSLTTKALKMILLWAAIAVIGRLIPHVPNFTPFTTLGVFAAAALPRRSAAIVTLGAAFLSDVVISLFEGCQVVGPWTFFTYSAWGAIAFFTPSHRVRVTLTPLFTVGGSFAFWIWTNFGSWLESGMYIHDFSGLISCYVLALPFLFGDLMGTLTWTAVMIPFSSMNVLEDKSCRGSAIG